MRIALIADIHGNLAALEAVLADLSRRDVEKVVNLGDHASGPLLPAETTRLLMSQSWVHLAGNHERQLLTLDPQRMNLSDAYTIEQLGEEELRWMAGQVPMLSLDDEEILLCHGSPRSDLEYLLETVTESGARLATADEISQRLGDTRARLVACAHTHMPRSVRIKQGKLIVNPGSVGLPAIDDVNPYPHVFETGSPDARYAVVEKRGAEWFCQLISVPYDTSPMVELALRRDREDWASALRTGYVS